MSAFPTFPSFVALMAHAESGHSAMPEASKVRAAIMQPKPFQDWVTREVLPAIRKTGGYLLNEDMRETAAADDREEFPLPVSFSDALRKLADEVERREVAERVTEELKAAREVSLEVSRASGPPPAAIKVWPCFSRGALVDRHLRSHLVGIADTLNVGIRG